MEAEGKLQQSEAHLLIFPFPLQGHVTTMLRLADALSAAGLRISFVNTDHNHHLLGRFSGSSQHSLRPNFRFLSIPDGLSDDSPRSVHQVHELEASLRTRSVDSFRSLLLSSGSQGSGDWPPVTCLLVDGLMPFAMDAAQNLGIPAIIFRTISTSCIWVYLRIPNLIEAGEIPFPEEADLDEPIRSVPGMESFLRRRDLPKTFRKVREAAGSYELQLLGDISESAARARGVVLNTCESLEGNILNQIRSMLPVTYAVGPLHALAAAMSSSSSFTSLRAEDRSVFEWLDAQPDRSVVYASFGSLARLTRGEFLEFWQGFVDSGHRFLWVLRPDLVEGGEDQMMMPEVERVRLVDWAPQEEVLRHRAVGCFLTHSGWNSTLESVAAGVPMVCWPFFMDQQINSRLVGEVWKVGLDMKDVCRKEVVERTVRAAMGGETAERLRRSAAERAEEVWRSVGEGGSSRLDFERLIQDILSLSTEGNVPHKS